MNQLLLTLRYYANGSFMVTVGDFVGVSKSTAQRIIHKVSHHLARLREQYIRFPSTDQELRNQIVLNYQVASFPGIVGLIDCTHVRITSPGGNNAETFRNRKGYFSPNVQATGNANLEFLDFVVRWPGSTHDVTIFNAFLRRAVFEEGSYSECLLLGDSGYPLTTYLMTPPRDLATRTEHLYNEAHIRTRNCIERLFGVWKRRFPCLALGLRVQLDKAFAIIVATAVLHNILRREDELPPDDPDVNLHLPWDELIQQGNVPQARQVIGRRGGEIIRQNLIQEYFGNL